MGQIKERKPTPFWLGILIILILSGLYILSCWALAITVIQIRTS